jgi:hypothetical protein
VHDFEDTLNHLVPASQASFEYSPTKGHGWQPMTNTQLVRQIVNEVEPD